MNKGSKIPRPVIFFKIAVAMAAAFLFLGGSLIAVSNFLITQKLHEQERQETVYLVERSRNALKVREKTLHTLAGRLAQSKALRTILAVNADHSADFDTDLVGLKERTGSDLYDFILFFNEDGKLTHEEAVAIVTTQGLRNAETTVQEVAQLAAPIKERLAAEATSSMSGLFLPKSGIPVLLAAAQVVSAQTDNAATSARSTGLLILGSYLDHALTRTINAENELTMRLGPVSRMQTLADSQTIKEHFAYHGNDILITPIDAYTNAGYSRLADISGHPALILEVNRNRMIYQQGMAQWRLVLAAVLAVQCALLLLLLILLHRMVFRRLNRLALDIEALAAVGHAGSRVHAQGNDEISWLARHLNDMLTTLDQCQAWQSDTELHLSQVLNSIQCGVMVVDAASRTITGINASGAAMVGLAPQEITGKLCHQFLCPTEWQSCPVLDLKEQINLSERALLRADGTQIPILKSVATVEKEGKRLLIESFIDISKRKQAEENLRQSESRYQRFFEENLAGSCIWTVDSVILDCNPAFAQLLGYDTVEAAKEAGMQEHCYFRDQREEMLALLTGKQSVERQECTLRHRNGTAVYCVANIYTQCGSDGTVREIRGYFFDDTKRILLERQNQQLGKMDALGALASGLAHDINNILASIQGNADLLCATIKDLLPAPARRALEDILRAGERAQGLTSQVLAFGRPQEKPAQTVRLAEMLDETLQILAATLPENVRLDAQIQSQGSTLAGENELHQVIMNLCVNAVQAMEAQGGTLRIVLDEVDQPEPRFVPTGCSTERMLRLRIDDTGCGIAPHLVERIFDPFFTTKTREVGNGLGLWLVKSHINAMHGQISLQSESGQGTSFILTLPLCSEPQPAPVVKTPALPLGHERIALVDDNPFVLEVCSAMLQQLGYSVQSFAQADEALAALKSGATPVDLLIVDNNMPEMDGCTLVRHLRENGFGFPVLLCLEKGNSVNLEETGISGILHKPVDMEQMAKSIRLILDCGRTFADNA